MTQKPAVFHITKNEGADLAKTSPMLQGHVTPYKGDAVVPGGTKREQRKSSVAFDDACAAFQMIDNDNDAASTNGPSGASKNCCQGTPEKSKKVETI